jgi:hypothetical protein
MNNWKKICPNSLDSFKKMGKQGFESWSSWKKEWANFHYFDYSFQLIDFLFCDAMARLEPRPPVFETSTCTIHNEHNRRTGIPSARFERSIPSIERMQTHVLNCAASGIGY